VYSLVSSSLLTIDLVRHPNAIELSDVLERSLRLTPGDMAALEATFEDSPERRAAWAHVQEATADTPRLLSVLVAAREAFADGTPAGRDLQRIGERLSSTPMGNLSELLSMVERDVLDWTRESHGDLVVQRYGHALAATRDAVAAAYARLLVAPSDCAVLAEPWLAVFGGLPTLSTTGDEYGPHTSAVRRAVDVVAHLDNDDFDRLNRAYWSAYSPDTGWAPAMHTASWAAMMSGRLRAVAGAQLALLRAMLLGGMPAVTGASGVMMAGTAAVQAAVLVDLLDDETYRLLTAPWTAALGRLQ
jgi:hypothetical protein